MDSEKFAYGAFGMQCWYICSNLTCFELIIVVSVVSVYKTFIPKCLSVEISSNIRKFSVISKFVPNFKKGIFISLTIIMAASSIVATRTVLEVEIFSFVLLE